MQRSNVINGGICGILGYPKSRKTHGYRVSIVDFLNRRDTGLKPLNLSRTISNIASNSAMLCGSLKKLRTINLKNPYDNINKQVINVISDMDVLILAYELIKPRNITKGSNNLTLDGIYLKWLEQTSKDLKAGKFHFAPLRVQNIRNKVVQKAMQLTLEAIFEPQFLENSHGFRPKRGTHTALKSIKSWFHGVSWVIEGDISKCSINNKVLLQCIRDKINCDKTISLINKALKAGYIDLPQFIEYKLGTPHEKSSVLSPLLCNILLHKLDKYMWELKTNFDRGNSRQKNSEYKFLQKSLTRTSNSEEKSKIRRLYWKVFSKDPLDPNFRRLFYIRYADDFVIGISGPILEVKEIKQKVSNFLKNSLSLELNEDKTKITNLNKSSFFFLGTTISGNRKKEKPIKLITKNGKTYKVRNTPRLSLHAPIAKLLEKNLLNGFFRRTKIIRDIKPTALRRMVNFEHADILRYYNQVIQGIINYYSFADNRKSLGTIIHGLKHSCALTLALKYKTRYASKIYKKFGSHLTCPETKMKLFIPNTFRRIQKFQINPPLGDIAIMRSWSNKLTRSNLKKNCIICGVSPVEMHHVRYIHDLKSKYKKKEIDFFTLQMAAMNRKQVPLCKEHHILLHKGVICI